MLRFHACLCALLLCVCSAWAAIDRRAVVSRHILATSVASATQLDSRDVYSLGNGAFAFNVDATGLQSLNDSYVDVPPPFLDLNTLSDWGWHSLPADGYAGRDDALTQFNWTTFQTATGANTTRPVKYAHNLNLTGPYRTWTMTSPHRLGLGQLALRMIGADGDATPIAPSAITSLTSTLDMWAGRIDSAFTLGTAASSFLLNVSTAVDPLVDIVATSLACVRVNGTGGCPAGVRLAFGYAIGIWGPSATVWDVGYDSAHTTTLLSQTATSVTIGRVVDDAAYRVVCEWDNGQWALSRTGLHSFVLSPPPAATATATSLSCLWAPEGAQYPIGMTSSPFVKEKAAATAPLLSGVDPLPLYPSVASAAASAWLAYWTTGAFVDLASRTSDPTAWELERRVILSRYLVRVHSAGSCPPQETGLISNSWSGKFHLEMRWWHHSHWSLWGSPDLLDRSNAFYHDVLPNATALAMWQGYSGARWSKMLGLANVGNASAAISVPWLGEDFTPPPSPAPTGLLLLWESAHNINSVLVWQQPHMVWLADLQVRAVNASSGPAAAAAAMAALSPLVFATADFLATFPYYNETSGYYEMGPPLLGGEEVGSGFAMHRPTFETVYFAYALDVANEWRAAMGLPQSAVWSKVAALLGNLPLDPAQAAPTYSFNADAACCYIPASACPPGRFGDRSQCTPQTGHPMPVGVLGMVNGRLHGSKYGVEVATANNTVAAIVSGWDWNSGGVWGWDMPVVALSQIRLGWDPAAIVATLTMNVSKNAYWRTGFNWQPNGGSGGGGFVYLPGNGGMLTAVAAMAGGMGSASRVGFPSHWAAQAEGFLVPYP